MPQTIKNTKLIRFPVLVLAIELVLPTALVDINLLLLRHDHHLCLIPGASLLFEQLPSHSRPANIAETLKEFILDYFRTMTRTTMVG